MNMPQRVPNRWPHQPGFPDRQVWRETNQLYYARLPGTIPLVIRQRLLRPPVPKRSSLAWNTSTARSHDNGACVSGGTGTVPGRLRWSAPCPYPRASLRCRYRFRRALSLLAGSPAGTGSPGRVFPLVGACRGVQEAGLEKAAERVKG
jgi:hypothetical protein